MWEETLGFFALMVPLTLALGYDRMVAAALIFLGAGTGVICSTVNPFATGVASDAAGIGLADGLGVRIAMWLVLVPIAIAYVIWYARRVQRDASKSVVGISPADAEESKGLVTDVPALTGRQKFVLTLFIGTFLVMIYGFIPWNDLWQQFFSKRFPLPTFTTFYFPEAAALFIVMAVVIGVIAKLGEEGTVNTIVAGAADFLGAALIVVVARGITVVMRELVHDRHRPALDGERGLGQLKGSVRDCRIHRQPADRVPRAVVVGPRSAGDADPGPAVGLRGGSARGGGDRVPVGLRAGEPRDANLGSDHGWACALEGRLRPLPEVRLALSRCRIRHLLRIHRRRGGVELTPYRKRRNDMETVAAPTIGANSEVGTLRTVIVHRPTSRMNGLSPTNSHELLFDDVIWVRRAQEEFDAFVEVMRGRGAEVLLFHDLLTETLEHADAREWVLSRRLRPEEVTTLFAREMTAWMTGMPAERARDPIDRRRDRAGAAERHGRDDRARNAPDRLRAAASPQPAVHPRHERMDLRRRLAESHVLAGAPARVAQCRGRLPLPSAVP